MFRAEFKERERIPSGVAVQAVRDVLAEWLVRHAAQQFPRRGPVQALEPEGRQVSAIEQRRLSFAHGKNDGDRIGDEAAEGEQACVGTRSVQPVSVVDENRYRRVVRIAGEQAERSRADGEAVLRLRGPERQGALERGRLRPRDLVHPGERRAQQLEQAGERDVRLGLHSPGAQHLHALRLLLGVGEQRGLADPGLADDGQDAAVAGASLLKHSRERQLLPIAAKQHVSECTEAPVRSHAAGSG